MYSSSLLLLMNSVWRPVHVPVESNRPNSCLRYLDPNTWSPLCGWMKCIQFLRHLFGFRFFFLLSYALELFLSIVLSDARLSKDKPSPFFFINASLSFFFFCFSIIFLKQTKKRIKIQIFSTVVRRQFVFQTFSMMSYTEFGSCFLKNNIHECFF